MDQTVRMSRVNQFPWVRVYYGESVVREIDARGAFGFEETELEGEDAKEAIETFKELGVEDPKGRAREMGYDPKLDKKKLPGSFTRKRLEEVQKEKMIKVLEDMVTKKSKDTDIQNKEIIKFSAYNFEFSGSRHTRLFLEIDFFLLVLCISE